MFKENSTEKLIEYIQTLPVAQRRVIAEKIRLPKGKKKADGRKISGHKIKDFIKYTKKLPARLPKNYKFDRDEANER